MRFVTPSNIIIADKAIIVNNFYNQNNAHSGISGISEITETIENKWTPKKERSLLIAKKLKFAGFGGRAERMKKCGDIISYYFCKDCGAYHIRKANLCRDRFCPICSWRLSLQRFSEMRRVIESISQAYPDLEYSLITLTVKNCKAGELHNTLKSMSTAWNRLLQRKTAKECIAGWAKSVELTYNEKTREMHPHYHIIVAWYKNLSTAFVQEWLESAKKSGLICDIKAQNAQDIKNPDGTDNDLIKAILETYKYNIKGSTLEKLPLLEFREIAEQWANKRLIAFGGIIKEYAAKCEINVEEIENEEDTIICRDCGGTNIDTIIYQWSFGEYHQLKT